MAFAVLFVIVAIISSGCTQTQKTEGDTTTTTTKTPFSETTIKQTGDETETTTKTPTTDEFKIQDKNGTYIYRRNLVQKTLEMEFDMEIEPVIDPFTNNGESKYWTALIPTMGCGVVTVSAFNPEEAKKRDEELRKSIEKLSESIEEWNQKYGTDENKPELADNTTSAADLEQQKEIVNITTGFTTTKISIFAKNKKTGEKILDCTATNEDNLVTTYYGDYKTAVEQYEQSQQ